MKARIYSVVLSIILMLSLAPKTLGANVEAVINDKKATYSSGMFSDVPGGSWYETSLAHAYELGLVRGATATTYNPAGNLTLAETITMASRLHSRYTYGTDEFVQGFPWYEVYVEYAISNGIITPSEFNDFTVSATRSQVAHIFSRSLTAEELRAINAVTALPDVNSTNLYYEDILLLYNAGIFTGSDSKGSFYPNSFITRSEMAAILCRMAIPSERKSFAPYGSEAYKAMKIAEEWSNIYATVTPSLIKEILVSDYMFTENEAEYAIKNARIDWNAYAQAYALSYVFEQEDLGIPYTEADIREYLKSEFSFTDSQADFALTYIDAEDDDIPHFFGTITDFEHFPAREGTPNALAAQKAAEILKNEPYLTYYGINEKLYGLFTFNQTNYAIFLGGFDWETHVVSQIKDEFTFYQNYNYTLADVEEFLSNYGYFFVDASTVFSRLKAEQEVSSTNGNSSEHGGNSGSSGTNSGVTVPNSEETTGTLVWVPTNGGTKYHSYSGCSNMIDPMRVSKETAIANGYTACGRCH